MASSVLGYSSEGQFQPTMSRIAVGGFQHETNTFAPRRRATRRSRPAAAGPACSTASPFSGRWRAPTFPPRAQSRRCARAGIPWSARPGRRRAVCARHQGSVRSHHGGNGGQSGKGPARRRRLPRPARRHGVGGIRGRRRRDPAPGARWSAARAHRGQPRPARQRDARHGRHRGRDGRLPNLSARRHGGYRCARCARFSSKC